MSKLTEREIKEALSKMGKQDKLNTALYRRVYSHFGLSSCELWIFYYLLLTAQGITQKDMCQQMFFPKQTINSAVSNLVKKGMLTLEESPDNRKNKIINLTEDGKKAAQETAQKLLQAEIKATEKLGPEKTAIYNQVRAEYYQLLKNEFESDFLKDEE